MAESSWPTAAGSRVVDDVQYEHMGWAWAAADGILGVPGDTTVVYGDSSGRQVKIRAGKRGHVRGRGWYSGTSDNILAIAANASGSTRTDLVVLRLTRSSTWAVSAAIVQGTPGAGVPAITQDATGSSSGVWEIPLAVVTVANNASTITAGNVADCTWYAHGDTIVTTSTASVQPLATSSTYRFLRHSDTGSTYEAVSGAWRRSPWFVAWGLVGGKRYPGSAEIGNGFSTYTDTTARTGTVSLLAGRRYAIELCFPVAWSSTSDVYAAAFFEVRKVSGGTVIGNGSTTDVNTTLVNFTYEQSFEYAPASNESVNFALYAKYVKFTGTTLNWLAILRSAGSHFWVRDLGPASTVTDG